MPSLSRSLTPITPTTTLGEAALAFLTTRKVRTDEDDLRDPTRRDGYSLGGISNLRWGLGFIFSIEFANKTTLAELELRDLKRSHVMIWLEQISRSPQRSAEYTALNAMKRLIRWCADADAVSLDVVQKIRTKYRARKGSAVTGEHREALRLVLSRRRSSIDPSSSDVAVLRGTLETGARCSEIRRARVRNFFFGPIPTLRYEAGKNAEPRIIVLSRGITRTIRERIVAHGLGPDDWIFFNPRTRKPWTQQHLQSVLIDAAIEAEVPDAHKLGTHSLRRGWATEARARGASNAAVSRSLGHDSFDSIKPYLRHEIDPDAVLVAALMNGENLPS